MARGGGARLTRGPWMRLLFAAVVATLAAGPALAFSSFEADVYGRLELVSASRAQVSFQAALSGPGGPSFLKETYANGVFRSDLDETAGSYGFQVALAPFQTASLALYVDAMGYLDYAGYGAAEPPPPPAVPAPAAGGLAALGLGALELLRRRKQRDRAAYP